MLKMVQIGLIYNVRKKIKMSFTILFLGYNVIIMNIKN